MSGKRQKTQYELALAAEDGNETRGSGYGGPERVVVKPNTESTAFAELLMEEVCVRGNLEIAWKRLQGYIDFECTRFC